MLALSAVGIQGFVSTSGISAINQAKKAFIRRILGIQLSPALTLLEVIQCHRSPSRTLPIAEVLVQSSLPSVTEHYIHSPCSKAWISPTCKSWPFASLMLWDLMWQCSVIQQTLTSGFQCAGDVKHEWRWNFSGYCKQNNVLMLQAGRQDLLYESFF